MAKKIAPISGFPEWLPAEQLVERVFIDTIRERFEMFGYGPIETRSVEPLDVLLKQGETDKEIYVLQRLQADSDDEDLRLGLHYFINSNCSLRTYMSYDQRSTHDSPVPDFSKLNAGGGVNLTISF